MHKRSFDFKFGPVVKKGLVKKVIEYYHFALSHKSSVYFQVGNV